MPRTKALSRECSSDLSKNCRGFFNTSDLKYGIICTMTQENSLRIDFLKFGCIILVVAIHSWWPLGQPWSLTWLANQTVFAQGLSRIAVPFFFVCSGYFLSKHLSTKNEWWVAVRKRVRTLVIPFVIWTVIGVIFVPICLAFFNDILTGHSLGVSAWKLLQEKDWIGDLGLSCWKVPGVYQLWYLRSLFLLVLLAPLISWCVQKLGWKWFVVCFVGMVLGSALSQDGEAYAYHFFRHFFSVEGLFYFSVGIYLHHKPALFPSRWGLLGGGVIVAFILIVVKLFLLANGFERCSYMCGEAAIPFMLYVVWCLTPAKNLPRWLRDMSFPIYVMHVTILYVFNPVLTRLLNVNEQPQICSLLRLCGGVFGSILIAHFLRQWCPRFVRLAFGER